MLIETGFIIILPAVWINYNYYMKDYSINNRDIRSVPASEQLKIKQKLRLTYLLKGLKKWCFKTNLLLAALLVGALFIPAGHAVAEAIGMSVIATPHIGYAAGVAYVNVDDPDGSTDRVWIFQPFRLIYTDKIPGGMPYRYWAELYYQEVSLDASSTMIGQFIKQYGVRASMQRKMWQTEAWDSWFGAGLDIADTKYDDRHITDSDGFLISRFEDRKDVEFGVLINFNSEIKLARNVVFSAKVEQIFATDKGIDTLLFSAVFLYRL